MICSSDRGVKVATARRRWDRPVARATALALIAVASVGCGEDRSPVPAQPPRDASFEAVCDESDGADQAVANRWREGVAPGIWTVDIDRLVDLLLSETRREMEAKIVGQSAASQAATRRDARAWNAKHGAEFKAKTSAEFGTWRLDLKADHSLTLSAYGKAYAGEWRACSGQVWLIRRTLNGRPAERAEQGPYELTIFPVGDGENGSLEIGAHVPLPMSRKR